MSDSNRNACRAALATPVGRGAVATILVHGADATDRVAPFFTSAVGRPLAETPLRRIAFGRWGGDDESPTASEELVVCRRTSEEIEIHCHGGVAAAARILADLRRQGCQEIAWQEFWEAPLAGRSDDASADPVAIAARIALADARTRRTAAILLDQHQGAWRREVERIEALRAAGQSDEVRRRVAELQSRAEIGRHLTVPWRVVLAGPPNVGKSSLINALLGYRRSIVFDQPGTTRDVVTATTAFDGWPVELADTAGLRTTDDRIESAGVERARQQLAAADLVVLVFDDQTAPGDWLSSDTPRRTLVVRNKCDLPSRVEGAQRQAVERPVDLRVSAATGEGIERLAAMIIQRLAPVEPPVGAAVPFLEQQLQWLRSLLKK